MGFEPTILCDLVVLAHLNSLTALRCHMKASHMNSLMASCRHIKAYHDVFKQPPK